MQKRTLCFSPPKWFRLKQVASLLLLGLAGSGCSAQVQPVASLNLSLPDWIERSKLIEIVQNNPLSKKASGFRDGHYELSTGELQRFDDWFHPTFQDMRLSWLLPITPDWGLVWGVGNGERADKYTIAPSIKLGFVMDGPLSHRSRLSLSASTWLGGRMREKPCSAFYAEFGADKAVNCRLAASLLPPEETLNYSVFAIPEDRTLIKLKYIFFY